MLSAQLDNIFLNFAMYLWSLKNLHIGLFTIFRDGVILTFVVWTLNHWSIVGFYVVPAGSPYNYCFAPLVHEIKFSWNQENREIFIFSHWNSSTKCLWDLWYYTELFAIWKPKISRMKMPKHSLKHIPNRLMNSM